MLTTDMNTSSSPINCFPGYEHSTKPIDISRYTEPPSTKRQSIYMGEDPSEGGYVFSRPGIYHNVVTFDVGGMHPASILALNKFGEYTQRYREIRDARVAIKHHEFEKARGMLDGKLAKYLTDEKEADNLAKALKLVCNSTYGYCSASFENPFKDSRDVDNIVAKRGALFMITLKNEVLARGFVVIQCKTDSIKVVNPTKELHDFIFEFGKKYGYEFEIESEYERICLVNRAVYIAKEKSGKWTATGAEFQHPYVFKTLFSHEPIVFQDVCETKEVKTSIYLDMDEKLPEGEHDYQFIGKVGSFVPIKDGCGGGRLVSKRGDEYYAVTGTKGYRWLESEAVQALGKESDVDYGYFRKLVDDAVDHINEFGDYYEFVGESESSSTGVIGSAAVPCGDGKYNSCFDCPKFHDGLCGLGYSIAVGDGERR